MHRCSICGEARAVLGLRLPGVYSAQKSKGYAWGCAGPCIEALEARRRKAMRHG